MKSDQSEPGDWRIIHEVASRIMKISGDTANDDTLMCSIVYTLTTERISRTLIEEYLKSPSSALGKRYRPTTTHNSW